VKRLVVVTCLMVWAITVSGMSVNVNIPATSVVDGLAAPKSPSQVAISCSGRVFISGSI